MLLLLGAMIAETLAVARLGRVRPLEDFMDGYNAAMEDWRIEEAEWCARLAVLSRFGLTETNGFQH